MARRWPVGLRAQVLEHFAREEPVAFESTPMDVEVRLLLLQLLEAPDAVSASAARARLCDHIALRWP